MQYRLLLLLSVVTLVAMPSSAVRACGNHSDADHALKYHHQHETIADHSAHACCDTGHSHADSEKNQNDEGDNHCHCPGCGGSSGSHAGGLAAAFYIIFSKPSEVWLQKQAFYFAEHLPEEVYLPIWQPPQLAA